jgi:membrane-associated phospholipid phosphatase
MGQPAPQIIGISMYAVGRLTNHRRIAQLGLHGTEAFLTSNVITTSIKMLAGRGRPRKVGADNPYDYKFGRGLTGGSDFQSFPSGHATTAFAVASAVTAETAHWWPRGKWLVGPVMYGGATMVGLSRMFNNAHWGSDVVAGAAIGTFSGLKVVRYNYRHPKNRVERALLAMKTLPGPDGSAIIAWTISTN